MKVFIFGIIIVVAVSSVMGMPSCLDAPALCLPTPYNRRCFNPYVALYEKFPVLYKIRKGLIDKLYDKIKDVNACPVVPKIVQCAKPSPVCNPPVVPPELLVALLSLNAAPPTPACSAC